MYSAIRNRKSILYSLSMLGVAAFTLYFAYHFRALLGSYARAEPSYSWAAPVLFALCLVFAAAYVRNMLMGFAIYLGLSYAVFDIAYGLFRILPSQAGWTVWPRSQLGLLLPLVIALLCCLGGYINAKSLRVKRYRVACRRLSPAQGPIRIAMISDLHLGTSIREREVFRLVRRINAQRPDLVLMCGDIYEERTTERQYLASMDAFRGLSARHGTYYIPGNHEYAAARGGSLDMNRLRGDLSAAGITMLRDEGLFIGGAVHLVGRDDRAAGARAEIGQLLAGAQAAYPVVLMDHKPTEMDAARESGVDLHLSGHTHAGQLFPIRRLGVLYGHSEMMYGLRTVGEYNAIVSSGAGTWGFPMRIGSSCEIVVIDMESAGETA